MFDEPEWLRRRIRLRDVGLEVRLRYVGLKVAEEVPRAAQAQGREPRLRLELGSDSSRRVWAAAGATERPCRRPAKAWVRG